MSVHINEVEVEPRRREEQQPAPAGGAGGGHEAPSPELANKVAATVALLHARDCRLVAD
jgi:hypothetical protein